MAELRMTTKDGGKTTIGENSLKSFASSLRGDLLAAESPGYDDARNLPGPHSEIFIAQMGGATRKVAADAVHVNFMTEEEDKRVRAAYGDSYDRLVELKQKYDPNNLFRLNQNISPNGVK